VAYVFDVSQVDPLPGTLPATPANIATAAATPADLAAQRCLEQLKAFLVGHNVELEVRTLAPGLLGSTDGRRITCALGQPPHGEFATLAHETTHVLLHFPRGTDGAPAVRPDLVTRETEAEAVAWLLCSQFGIAGTDASVEYIRSYRGTPDTLEASLTRIRDTAARLTTALEEISFAARPVPR
jgi:hypothetical protein